MFFGRQRAMATDGVIDLVPIRLYPPPREMGFGECHDFLITPHNKRREAGRISLRLGESECVYYFGHIGYHVDPPYQGNHFALRACKLLKSFIEATGKDSVVITADPDNVPSRKVCEGLGCVLENIVSVPDDIQRKWEISPVKCRYIWRLNPDMNL